ncbi:hypothetical protein E2C01_041384 [Portunus trituberculatus]|uniref:Uncharacterized protein n=1 Tax=Portunus trituberculatus TaxID=210409 RepID=A0A5B7FTF9_PORTR|nr:hypothetical protein [Portunus trituberculatus]
MDVKPVDPCYWEEKIAYLSLNTLQKRLEPQTLHADTRGASPRGQSEPQASTSPPPKVTGWDLAS